MDAITRMAVQAGALIIFIAAASWGAVRTGLVGLAATKYFQMRAEQYPAVADLPRPRILAHTQLLITAAVCWPAAVVFTVVRVTHDAPSLPWIVVAAAGTVAAVVAAAVASRSPWARLRARVSRAARMPLDRRDEVLRQAFDMDPQLKESGDVRP